MTQKLLVFNHVSLDGYFVDGNGSMSWAHGGRSTKDDDWNSFVQGNMQGNGTLLFGRVTYDLMNSYWPTSMAKQNDAAVAERMNAASKVVFSRTMDQATWNNTRLVKHDLVAEVRKMKSASGDGLVILGSGSIVSQLAAAGLIDEYQLVVNPVILGRGRTLFESVQEKLGMKLTKSRAFSNGNAFLCYEPAA